MSELNPKPWRDELEEAPFIEKEPTTGSRSPYPTDVGSAIQHVVSCYTLPAPIDPYEVYNSSFRRLMRWKELKEPNIYERVEDRGAYIAQMLTAEPKPSKHEGSMMSTEYNVYVAKSFPIVHPDIVESNKRSKRINKFPDFIRYLVPAGDKEMNAYVKAFIAATERTLPPPNKLASYTVDLADYGFERKGNTVITLADLVNYIGIQLSSLNNVPLYESAEDLDKGKISGHITAESRLKVELYELKCRQKPFPSEPALEDEEEENVEEDEDNGNGKKKRKQSQLDPTNPDDLQNIMKAYFWRPEFTERLETYAMGILNFWSTYCPLYNMGRPSGISAYKFSIIGAYIPTGSSEAETARLASLDTQVKRTYKTEAMIEKLRQELVPINSKKGAERTERRSNYEVRMNHFLVDNYLSNRGYYDSLGILTELETKVILGMNFEAEEYDMVDDFLRHQGHLSREKVIQEIQDLRVADLVNYFNSRQDLVDVYGVFEKSDITEFYQSAIKALYNHFKDE